MQNRSPQSNKTKPIATRKMGWFFIQDLNQQPKKRVLRGVSQLSLSFILHFVAHHVSVFIPIEIYLSIQYSSETVTHLLSMMIAECSSVSLLLFLLHSYAFCYCNLQLSQVSAIKHTSNGMQNRKCRIFLTLHKTPHTNFPLVHTPTSQFVAH